MTQDQSDFTVIAGTSTSLLTLLAPHLRTADVVEIRACGFDDNYTALVWSCLHSDRTFTVLLDGLPVGLFGVSSGGHLWMVGSEPLIASPRRFLRHFSGWIELLGLGFTRLSNRVHYTNTTHIRFLKWVGARFSPRQGDFMEFTLCVYQQQPCRLSR